MPISQAAPLQVSPSQQVWPRLQSPFSGTQEAHALSTQNSPVQHGTFPSHFSAAWLQTAHANFELHASPSQQISPLLQSPASTLQVHIFCSLSQYSPLQHSPVSLHSLSCGVHGSSQVAPLHVSPLQHASPLLQLPPASLHAHACRSGSQYSPLQHSSLLAHLYVAGRHAVHESPSQYRLEQQVSPWLQLLPPCTQVEHSPPVQNRPEQHWPV
jgi:hypothetical protein